MRSKWVKFHLEDDRTAIVSNRTFKLTAKSECLRKGPIKKSAKNRDCYNSVSLLQ